MECSLFSKIPCRLYWHDLYESTLEPWIWYRPQSWGHAVAVDKAGYVYLSGYYKDDQDNVNRILLKYHSNGIPVTADLIIDIPWYEGIGTYEELGDSFWTPHKLLVDNERRRLYVLTALIPPGSADTPVREYHLWLHCHDLDTSEKRWTALAGNSRYHRGEASLRTGLDIDTDGNVWTVIEDYVGEFHVAGGNPFLGVKVRKWSGENGTNIGNYDGGKDYAHVFTFDTHRELVAFGVRSDNKKIFAFREKPTGPPAVPHDLTIVIYNADCRNFIGRYDYLKELDKSSFPLPPPEPGDTIWQPQKAHPYFSGGFLDDNDRLQIAGCYIFSREEEVVVFSEYTEFITQRFLTLLTFDLSGLQTDFPPSYAPSEFIEQDSASEPRVRLGWLPKPEAEYGHNITAKPGPRDGVLLSFLKPYYGCFPVVHLVEGGNVVESVRLNDPQSGNYGSSNCIHRWSHFATDFTYVPGQGRLGVAGFLKKRGYHTNECPWQGDHYKAIVAYYGPWFRISGPIPIPFQWFARFPRYQDFWPWFNLDWFKLPPEFPDLPPRLIRSAFGGPSYLVGLYRQIHRLVSLRDRVEFAKGTLRTLSRLIEEVPDGGRFNSDLKKETYKALKGILRPKGLTKAHKRKLIEALNSIELDWRYPHASKANVRAKDNVEVRFGGALSLCFESVSKSGKCTLKIKSGVPALVNGLEPVWPVSNYAFEFTGEISKGSSIDVGIHVGNQPRGGPGYIPHILQWDGKSYKDITTGFDTESGLVTGRTNKLSPLAVFGSKGPPRKKEHTRETYKSSK